MLLPLWQLSTKWWILFVCVLVVGSLSSGKVIIIFASLYLSFYWNNSAGHTVWLNIDTVLMQVDEQAGKISQIKHSYIDLMSRLSIWCHPAYFQEELNEKRKIMFKEGSLCVWSSKSWQVSMKWSYFSWVHWVWSVCGCPAWNKYLAFQKFDISPQKLRNDIDGVTCYRSWGK